MFDNVCKFLAQAFSQDFAAWLLGEAIPLTELSPSELSLEPIRADALILLESDNTVLHVEFQTQPDADMPFRMIDYRLRVYRRYPNKQMRQFVIYLRETGSELVQQTEFAIAGTRHEFNVIRLWEQPFEVFLRSHGLLPLAVLSQTTVGKASRNEDRASALVQVAEQIDLITDQRTQRNIAAASAILAGLILEKNLVKKILRKEIMRESAVYQEIWQEATEEGLTQGRAQGRAQGLTEGREEGRMEALEQVALNLLEAGMPVEQVEQMTGLSIEQVRQLAERRSQTE